jgi:hypothetical protein
MVTGGYFTTRFTNAAYPIRGNDGSPTISCFEWILFIFIPRVWVGLDIFSDFANLIIRSDNALVVVALPQPAWEWCPFVFFHTVRKNKE